MNKTRFEYETFDLADYTHPAMRYHKILSDIENAQIFYGRHINLKYTNAKYLLDLKSELDETYSKEELKLTNRIQTDFWINKLGKDAAIQMIMTSRVDHDTMLRISCLEDNDFEKAIMTCARLASEIDKKVKEAEKRYKLSNHNVL